MQQAPLDKNLIVVGKPLPFSIFSADRKLLLAEGQIVPSQGARAQWRLYAFAQQGWKRFSDVGDGSQWG